MSASGWSKKATVRFHIVSITSVGTPWSMIVRKPTSRHARSHSSATCCLPAALPSKKGFNEMTGTVVEVFARFFRCAARSDSMSRVDFLDSVVIGSGCFV